MGCSKSSSKRKVPSDKGRLKKEKKISSTSKISNSKPKRTRKGRTNPKQREGKKNKIMKIRAEMK